MGIEGDYEEGVCRAVSTGITGFSKLFGGCSFDAVIVLGDRYELLAVCTAALIYRVPIVHIHGGEVTFGAVDDAVRHAVSKMASIHFASIEPYARRIIQMGEDPQRVFTVGALGIDNIKKIKLMDKEELYGLTGVDFNSGVALMTYHPSTLSSIDESLGQASAILESLLETDLLVLATMPNADAGGIKVYNIIKEYADRYPEKIFLMKNLGTKVYLNAMNHARLMIGNSSSGILESASFALPVINVGDRQNGRFRPANVIDCDGSRQSLKKALRKALSQDFKRTISGIGNPYGDGRAALRIVEALKTVDFTRKADLLKKGFYDLDFRQKEMT